jgi:hypothetical protein
MFGIDATETAGDCSARGASASVFHATSGSIGRGSVARYWPSHPGPALFNGLAVAQISVPWKCDRLEFA